MSLANGSIRGGDCRPTRAAAEPATNPLAYVHPVLGVVAIGLTLWIGLQGVRSRHKRPYAQPARRRHHDHAPRIALLGLVVAVLGTVSAWLWRPDLPVLHLHLVAGWTFVALMGTLWVLSWRFGANPWTRTVHPWVGWAAMGVAVLLGVLGLGMLR